MVLFQKKMADAALYEEYKKARDTALDKLLNSPNRFQRIGEREDRSDYPPESLKAQSMGKCISSHRGCLLLKSADDVMIVQQLLWHLRPATVIELGTFTGGSALWLADMLQVMDIPSQIYSMDITLSNIEDRVRELKPQNVTFLQGDCRKIEETFTAELLKSLPRPWLVIDDAHVNVYGVLEYFDKFMSTGDYFIVEDTNPDIPSKLGYGHVCKVEYKKLGMASLEVLKKFLTDYSEKYAVDSFYTDFYGYNGTWNWHGYIRRM